jgi:hypothetical protein
MAYYSMRQSKPAKPTYKVIVFLSVRDWPLKYRNVTDPPRLLARVASRIDPGWRYANVYDSKRVYVHRIYNTANG